MNAIPIQLGPAPTGYHSAEKAIQAVECLPNQQCAQADSLLLAGSKFLGGQWNLSRWLLEFSGGYWLDIIGHAYDVNWQVHRSRPQIEPTNLPYSVLWPGGEVTAISPADLFSRRVDADFWLLFAIERSVGVYLRRHKSMYLRALANAESGEPLLYVYEQD